MRCTEILRGFVTFVNLKSGIEQAIAIMKSKQLIALCDQMVQSYNPLIMTPDIHADQFLKLHKLTSHSEELTMSLQDLPAETDNGQATAVSSASDKEVAAIFLREVFYGLDQYEKLIKLVVDGLYDYHKSGALRADRNLYCIVTYLTLVRCREKGFEDWQTLINGLPRHQMSLFLGFLKHEEAWLQEQLCLLYDGPFVRDVMWGPLTQHAAEIQSMLDQYIAESQHKEITAAAAAADPMAAFAPKRKASTKPEPFNLTRPRPRVIPEPPIVFESDYKSKPVPEMLRATSLADIEKDKEERRKLIRQQTVSKLAEAAAPDLRVSHRPMHLPQLLQEAEKELASQYVKFRAQPPPPVPTAAPTKLTAAQLLREDALFRRKQELEAAAIRAFEFELRDGSEFEQYVATFSLCSVSTAYYRKLTFG